MSQPLVEPRPKSNFPEAIATIPVDEEITLHGDEYRQKHATTLFYEIVHEGQKVGRVGLYGWIGDKAWLSYTLDENHQDKKLGLATRAAASLCRVAFSEWEIDNILLIVQKNNEPSKGVAHRLGAKLISEGAITERWQIKRGENNARA